MAVSPTVAVAVPLTPEAHISRGAFIVIEGLDRSGKTTQVQRLAATLSQHGQRQVQHRRFPDRSTVIGQMIDQYLQSQAELEDHVIHLLFSANRWEVARAIETDLAQGRTIVCDRYVYSGMVYSAAKRNPNLSLAWAREPDVGLPRPDLVLFLDLNPDAAAARGGFGDEKYERREMQENVRRLFLSLKDAGEEEADDMVVIDASGSVEDVAQSITDVVLQKLAYIETGGLGTEVRRIGNWRREG